MDPSPDPIDSAESAPIPVRVVSDVATLKALSDPLRVAILRVLMDGAREQRRTRSAKELASELDEPQTKLYRHIKQLHAQRLIEVAETRLVSGIVEHRYRAGQLSLDIDPAIFGQSQFSTDDAAKAFAVIIDNYRNDFVASIRAGLIQFGSDHEPDQSYLKAVSSMSVTTVAPARAVEFHDRLAALVDEISTAEHEPDGVPIRFLAAFYSPSATGPTGHTTT